MIKYLPLGGTEKNLKKEEIKILNLHTSILKKS